MQVRFESYNYETLNRNHPKSTQGALSNGVLLS